MPDLRVFTQPQIVTANDRCQIILHRNGHKGVNNLPRVATCRSHPDRESNQLIASSTTNPLRPYATQPNGKQCVLLRLRMDLKHCTNIKSLLTQTHIKLAFRSPVHRFSDVVIAVRSAYAAVNYRYSPCLELSAAARHVCTVSFHFPKPSEDSPLQPPLSSC